MSATTGDTPALAALREAQQDAHEDVKQAILDYGTACAGFLSSELDRHNAKCDAMHRLNAYRDAVAARVRAEEAEKRAGRCACGAILRPRQRERTTCRGTLDDRRYWGFVAFGFGVATLAHGGLVRLVAGAILLCVGAILLSKQSGTTT